MNLIRLVSQEIENGYDNINAQAKVCQDLILKAISLGSLNRNVTIKGGVVMRSKSGNTRRATQDLDIDFIRYSLDEHAIDLFIEKLNCIDGIHIIRKGEIVELKQQDYNGKRVYIQLMDDEGNIISSKLDLGVHNRFDIQQEEYCFDIAFDEAGASLLINSNEQMFSEKLRSLLRFGTISTRYKDIFDMYFLCSHIDKKRLMVCLDSYIFNDSFMRENDMAGVIRRIKMVFHDSAYRKRLKTTDKKWMDESIEEVIDGLVRFLESL